MIKFIIHNKNLARYLKNINNINLKIFSLNKWLFIFLFITPIENSSAQIGPIFKSIFKNGAKSSKTIVIEETEAIAKNVLKTSDESLIILQSNKELADGYKLNLNDFVKKNKKRIIEESLDFSSEVISESSSELIPQNYDTNSRKELVFVGEIFSNKNYPNLYKKICEKFKVISLTKNEIIRILNGSNYGGDCIKPNKLYSIYFGLSNSFAKIELVKLQIHYKCDETAINIINNIAAKRKIKLIENKCENNENTDFVFGSVFILILIGIVIRLLKKGKKKDPQVSI